jgi:hypothetical protein
MSGQLTAFVNKGVLSCLPVILVTICQTSETVSPTGNASFSYNVPRKLDR